MAAGAEEAAGRGAVKGGIKVAKKAQKRGFDLSPARFLGEAVDHMKNFPKSVDKFGKDFEKAVIKKR